MLRSAQPSQFSTYPSQYIDTPGLAVLISVNCKDKQVYLSVLVNQPSNPVSSNKYFIFYLST